MATSPLETFEQIMFREITERLDKIIVLLDAQKPPQIIVVTQYAQPGQAVGSDPLDVAYAIQRGLLTP